MRFLHYILFFLFVTGKLFAQDSNFSQFFANPLYLNPALTGTSELPRLTMNYRNQWPQKGATYTTYSVSYDQILKNSKTGLGFQLIRDQELNNVINSNSASAFYSHHIQLGLQSFLTLGVQSGITLKQFNINNLVFPSGIDQMSGKISEYVMADNSGEKRFYPDFAVGALGQHGEYYWGTAIHHFTRPDESIIKGDQKGRVPVKATLHAGAMLFRLHHGLLSRFFTLSPNILYQQQGSFKQLNLGIYMVEKSFIVGGWYRNNIDVRPDALIAMAGFTKGKLRIGYSFDLTLSKLSNYSYGSHEISLMFHLGQKKDSNHQNKLLIPMI
ncbi:MAG: type IX secretion system membrane protein PorP/SprF [Mariniphaga sp.]|jgi:type IX secretion system PorP/SprF family membrane protein|nr:type IX secretion system membrane protein PorP/SprF [Mariniphaga sp.]